MFWARKRGGTRDAAYRESTLLDLGKLTAGSSLDMKAPILILPRGGGGDGNSLAVSSYSSPAATALSVPPLIEVGTGARPVHRRADAAARRVRMGVVAGRLELPRPELVRVVMAGRLELPRPELVRVGAAGRPGLSKVTMGVELKVLNLLLLLMEAAFFPSMFVCGSFSLSMILDRLSGQTQRH